MPKSMFDIFSGSFNGKARSCPECESAMQSNGCCSECVYGEEADMMEEEEDDSAEDMHKERMIEIRDDLQRLVDKMSKLAGDKKEEEPENESYMLPTVFAVRRTTAPN